MSIFLSSGVKENEIGFFRRFPPIWLLKEEATSRIFLKQGDRNKIFIIFFLKQQDFSIQRRISLVTLINQQSCPFSKIMEVLYASCFKN